MSPAQAFGVKKVHIIGETPIVDIDKWCVIKNYTDKYIVKLPNGFADAEKAMAENSVLVCEDAIQYATPLKPVQTPNGISFALDNIIHPIDIMSGPVKLRAIVTNCYPVESDDDKDRYKNFIEATLQSRKEQIEAERRNCGG